MALDTIGKRLKWARERMKRWDTATEAAEAHGWKVPTYLGHENGDRNPSRANAKKYAKAYGVRWAWLLENDGPPFAKGKLRGVADGRVGAGAEVYPLNDDSLGDEIELPPGAPADALALQVTGDSMYPRYFEGEYLFYLPEQRSPGELIGRECVVKLADGRIFVKILRKGTTKHHFTLESWNAPPMLDQVVEWACLVRWRG